MTRNWRNGFVAQLASIQSSPVERYFSASKNAGTIEPVAPPHIKTE
jgi:hypothetical protein